VDGGSADGLSAARVLVERTVGEPGLGAGLAHRLDDAGDVAGYLLGDDDSGLYFGDGASLLDCGCLADELGALRGDLIGRQRHQFGVAHAACSSC
jgi:hypothetical protein